VVEFAHDGHHPAIVEPAIGALGHERRLAAVVQRGERVGEAGGSGGSWPRPDEGPPVSVSRPIEVKPVWASDAITWATIA
jgi:hypothetical protein